MNSLKFLEELYPDKPDNAHILLWQSKRSSWFTDIPQAADFIEKNPEDMYYGVGLSPKNFGTGRRCKADQIMGIPGLYADIDVGEGSKKYPPTVDDAISLVTGIEFEPSMIVNSGNGLHIYWLFKEPWIFDDDAERNFAATLSRRINLFTKERAIKKGWNTDNVSDLARILRPVGSLNCKGPPKPVTIIINNKKRYSDPDYFDQILPPLGEYDIQPQEKISPQELTKIEKIISMKKIAEPPQEKLDLLIEADPYFKALWQKHKDVKKDTSVSGFHMSLANVAAKAAWKDQEITDLLIAWNRRHGEPLDKLMKRPDYIAGTIARARKNSNEFYAEKYTEDIEALAGTKYGNAMKDSLKKKGFEIISHHLGFKISSFINYVQEKNNKYVMESDQGQIIFYGVDEIHMKSKFEQRILGATNKAISLSRKNFEVVKSTYKTILENIVVSRESTIKGRMTAWLIEYLDGQPPLDKHESTQGERPFVFKGHWYVYPTPFREWAFRSKHSRDGLHKTEFDLTYIGAFEQRMNLQRPLTKPEENDFMTKRPWIIPRDVIAPEVGHGV